MKPHEQEWVAGLEPYGNGERVVVRANEGRTVAHFPVFDSKSRAARKANADLISAAPDMARALLADLEDHGGAYSSDPCRCAPCERRRTALRKAGVIS